MVEEDPMATIVASSRSSSAEAKADNERPNALSGPGVPQESVAAAAATHCKT